MKALISAFALLAFVAASTVPYAAEAQTMPPKHHVVKKHHVTHKKVAHKKVAKKKHVASARKKPMGKKKMSPVPASKG